jgi:hypothetical protein
MSVLRALPDAESGWVEQAGFAQLSCSHVFIAATTSFGRSLLESRSVILPYC